MVYKAFGVARVRSPLIVAMTNSVLMIWLTAISLPIVLTNYGLLTLPISRQLAAAFIIDVFARVIVGWKVSNRMNTDMVMAALNQAITDRNNPKDVIHHSDRGVQYLSIRYTDKMKDSGVIASVGTTGDACDNALAETVNGLYKSEVIHYLKESWNGINDVELETLE